MTSNNTTPSGAVDGVLGTPPVAGANPPVATGYVGYRGYFGDRYLNNVLYSLAFYKKYLTTTQQQTKSAVGGNY
jgi:hypothetical protein